MTRRVAVMSLALVAVMAMTSLVAQAAPMPLATRHTRDAVVNGTAQSLGRMPATQTIRFDIVLALRHAPELENFLQEVYDPASPMFRQFVTPKEFTERFGPSQEDFEALVNFAKASGFTVIGGSRDAMDVQLKGTVGAIEKAFHVQMGLYQHPTENRKFYAPDRELTVDLPFQLWHITGLDNYSKPHPLYVRRNIKVKSEAQTGSCPDESFCGSDMRAAYYESTTLTGAGQNVGLLEYAGFDIADVNTYYQNAGQTRYFAVTGVSTDGSPTSCYYDQGCDDTEQTIDITQAGGMAPNVTTVYVFVSDSSDTALLGSMSSYSPLPLNLSSSWIWSPPDPSTDDPYFEKMASQGQSFFQAAGDGGGYEGSAPWPSNSAYVIAVGGTDLFTQSAGGPWASETVWEYGGAGFGTNVPIPSWQKLAGVITSQNEGSKAYRDVPDVGANANFTFYVCADQSGCTANEYGGTSFAAPMWAGYLALTNQQAVTNSVPPPGFINPTIYPLNLSNGDAYFHDITSDANGSNGFPCVTGYNLCDGWGSPNGAGLINALAGLPSISFTPTSLTFGKTKVGKTSAAKAVTIENSGGGVLVISNLATTGDFALATVKATKKVTPCVAGTNLAAGASCEVKVTFTPTKTGTLTGDLQVSDNVAGSPQDVGLTGTGID